MNFNTANVLINHTAKSIFLDSANSTLDPCENNSMFQIRSISDLKFETSAMTIGKNFIRLQWIQPPTCENFQFTLQVFNNISMSQNNISLSCCERELTSTDIFYQEGGTSLLRLIGTNESEPCNRGNFFNYTFKGNMKSNE